MKDRFEDRIGKFTSRPAPGEPPAASAIEAQANSWKLTRRSLIGLLAAGTFAAYKSADAAGTCGSGAFAHQILLDSLSFLPDGKTLVSAGRDGLMKFWTIPDAALFRTVSTSDLPLQIAVSPDGNQIAIAMWNGHLELWSANFGTRRALLGHTSSVTSVSFSADGAQLASVSQDRTTRLWSVRDATLQATFSDTTETMTQVAIPPPAMRAGKPIPQRRYLVTAGSQVHLRLFGGGETVKSVPGKAFAISSDGQFLAAHDGSRIYMYAFPSLTQLVSFVGRANPASLAFSADGKRLAVSYTDVPAQLYSAPDLTLVRNLDPNEGSCLAAAMDSRNSYFAVASGKSVRLYSLPAGNRVQACFMDLAASSPFSSGTQYVLGGVTYTIGCTAGVPAEAVCTCNCVPGHCPCVSDSGCGCNSDVGCDCDSDSGCSCDYDSGCSCVGDSGCSCVGDSGCWCVGDSGCSCVGDSGCSCVGNSGCSCVGDSGCWCVGDSGCSCVADYGCGCVDDFGGWGGCGCDGD